MTISARRGGWLPAWLRKRLVSIRAVIFDVHAVRSYSQEGEDLILARIFGGQRVGFYVDVGAHHPTRFSNTAAFYRRGWHGINIEPNPELIPLFQKHRRRDVNLQLGISDHAGALAYYQFDEPALNSFDEGLVRSRLENTAYRLLGTLEIKVRRLDDVLREYLPRGAIIDFLSIDAEGSDFAVLRSNDWTHFRPRCVLVETLQLSLEGAMRGEIVTYMRSHGYEVFAKTYNTLILRNAAQTSGTLKQERDS